MNRLFVRSKVVALFVRVVMVSLCVSAVNHVVAEDKPVAICGFSTDVRGVEMEVMRPGRYVYEKFENKWLPPADFGKYSIVYYGEKIDGAAKGKNWKDDASRAAIKKYLDEGGVLIVSGDWCLRQLMGNEDRKKPDPLRRRIIHLKKLIGRLKANLHKEGKRLGYADDAGIFILTPEGQEVQRIVDEYVAVFGKVKGVQKIPVEGKWDTVPLGEPGSITYSKSFKKRPSFSKPVERKDGLVLLDGSTKGKISLGDCGDEVRALADELAWHLERMSGVRLEIVSGEVKDGPALVYRKMTCPKGFSRGEAAYFKIWREGDKVYLGGEDTGLSRATTYVLEALGCRYIWPGATGKVIPKKSRIVLPEISVEDATPFVVRRIRLYGKPERRDREENRDFYRWHGINDMSFMTTGWPGPQDDYQWGHYYGDYYTRKYKSNREWFALQPDGTRNLHIGTHTERPTFCLSNRGMAEYTASRMKAGFRANPRKKCLSMCLPDSATSSQCMCEECRRLDPVNAAEGRFTVYFPERRSVKYVVTTDRVFTYMNRVAEEVAKEHPDKLLSCYAYGSYTEPPVRVRPHKNLIILSVAGYYPSRFGDNEVERNVCAWHSFGNRILWRPNAHAGFGVAAPDNIARRMFDDISLLAENGIFGVDYDTMGDEWATKAFMYYMVCKAHFNPDRLDFDSIADDYCRAAFGAGWRHMREYFDIVEKAADKAAEQNSKAPPAITWELRVAASCRLIEATDYDALRRCLALARAAAGDDESVLFRLRRIEFGTELGWRMKKIRPGKASAEEKEEARRFIRQYLDSDPSAYPITSLTIR